MQISCKLIAFGLAAIALSAARGGVPTEWQVRIGPKATVYQAERYHGDALDLRATLTSGGMPLVYQGAARLYAQTNGMGALWWDLAPVTVASNVLAATWRPEFDTGADVVDVFLGAPSNFQAHARIRFLPAPGPAPNSLPMPTPVLDFSAVELRNISALTNGWSFGDSGGPYLSATGGVVSGTVKVEGKVGASADNGDAELGGDGVRVRRAAFPFSQVLKVKWPSAGNGTFARLEDIPSAPDLTDATNYTDKVAADMFVGATNAAVAVANAKISTNNSAFVAAVLAAPLAGASASDIEEIAEYGGYGTVGAALLALIAGLAALKRRVTSAETALAQKADADALPYAMVTPGKWEFSADGFSDVQKLDFVWYDHGDEDYRWDLFYDGKNTYVSYSVDPTTMEITGTLPTEVDSNQTAFTATRPSLPGHLCARANNLIDATTGNVTLTLPQFEAGKVRDLLVACTIGLDGNDEPWSVIFQGGDGEEISFKAEGDDAASATFPVPGAAGDWWYSLTERAPHVFAVSLKQLQSVSQPTQTQTQGGS